MSEDEERRLTELLVSPRTGLITEVKAQIRGAEEPVPPYLYTSTLAHFDFRPAAHGERLNAGKGRTKSEARLSAMGEAVERYSAYHWDPTRVWVGLADVDAITPGDCVLYSQTQYEAGMPYRTWSPEIEMSWINGVELPSGKPVAMPAALVYLVNPLPRIEDYITSITSNGLSAGLSLTQAILGGFYEVIERDALMITWLNKLPATRIKSPDQGCYAAPVIRHYHRLGVVVRLFLLATDQAASVVLAVADNPVDYGPARVVGMGCDIDPVVAVDKAVFEMCQARPSELTRFHETNPAARLKHYSDVVDLDDHPGFHCIRENLGEFDFLSAGDASVTLSELTKPPVDEDVALESIVKGLRLAGARVAYADITTADVASTGMHAVRCIATGFQPIHFGFGEGRLGGSRLFDAPVDWGLSSTRLTEDKLNPCPHPLA